MSDYTPTTEDIKYAYAHWKSQEPEFDRWLAEVKAKAIAEDREALREIAKGKNKGCSEPECEECERIMLVDDIVVSRAMFISQLEGEVHTHTRRSSFGDPYCETCGIDLEDSE